MSRGDVLPARIRFIFILAKYLIAYLNTFVADEGMLPGYQCGHLIAGLAAERAENSLRN